MNKTETEQMVRAFLNARSIFAPGNVFYVCNATATGTRNAGTDSTVTGRRADSPLATIDYAIGLCTAANGDVIVVLPGHAESISTASFITMDVSGVTIVGIGNGRNRPVLTWTLAAGTIVVSAANCRITNMVMTTTADAIVSAISVTATDFEFDHNEMELSKPDGTAKSMILGILTAATATRLNVHHNFFHCPITITTNTVTAAIQHEVGTDFQISDNIIQGKLTQGILNATTILRGVIARNEIHVYTGTAAITLETSTQCHCDDNRMVVASGTAPIVGAAASFTKNSYTTEGNGPTAGTASTF